MGAVATNIDVIIKAVTTFTSAWRYSWLQAHDIFISEVAPVALISSLGMA